MGVTNYVWDPVFDYLTEELDDAGNVIAEYTHEPKLHGPLIPQHRNGVNSFYHYDAMGTTRALTNSNQNITDTAAYTAFGEKVASTGTTVNPFGFIGALGYYANPVTNNTDIRRRNSSARIARWLSVDDFAGNDEGPYLYVNNQPTIKTDPSGMYAILQIPQDESKDKDPPSIKCPPNPKACRGGYCIFGKKINVKSCEITKLKEIGWTYLCRVVTPATVCSTLIERIKAANKKHGDGAWVANYCAPDCECDKQPSFTKAPVTIIFSDDIIINSGCTFEVSGKIEIDAGEVAIGSCKKKGGK